ncbi:Hypothetical Protein FCC1311_047371 [Hondaea fermentalgiana]|uniref:Lipin/Ned1/Smp2 (LNS2) domain-containing protein n=1 Tax=Hondaea fermentalgiana TaxID=2315210 RepID=A0A2R5G4V3_9STRA|nr:Hypothetical Protein FCC1311_047371 [Hondaea fermentalgiana]|eukprot:GBG25585.1 Hypothetical Protein FCC1311_047371 [Hondaea fermentalgiana]
MMTSPIVANQPLQLARPSLASPRLVSPWLGSARLGSSPGPSRAPGVPRSLARLPVTVLRSDDVAADAAAPRKKSRPGPTQGRGVFLRGSRPPAARPPSPGSRPESQRSRSSRASAAAPPRPRRMAGVWAALARLLFAQQEAVGAGDVVLVRGRTRADGKREVAETEAAALEATPFLAHLGRDVAGSDDDDDESVDVVVGDEEERDAVEIRVNGTRIGQRVSVAHGKPSFAAARKGPALLTPGPEAAEIALHLGQTTRLHGAALRELPLHAGRNQLSYTWVRGNGQVQSIDDAAVYVLASSSRMVVVNLDVFVQLEASGAIAPVVSAQTSLCARTLARIARNAYGLLFVSARFSVERATELRELLFTELDLPLGPMLLHGNRAGHRAALDPVGPRAECQRFNAETLRELCRAFGRNPFVALFTDGVASVDPKSLDAPRSRTYAPDFESSSGWASGCGRTPLQDEVVDLAFPKIATKACFGYNHAVGQSIYFYA